MYVYIVTNRVNGKKYIGLSINKKKWFRDSYYGSGKLIKKAIEKYGKENFTKEIVKEFDTEKECREYERLLIESYNAVDDPMFYNLAPGGYGGACKGHIVNEETREKIKKRNSGENHFFKKMSIEEQKEFSNRMSLLKMGSVQSEETREKRRKSLNLFWKNLSEDDKKERFNKISKTQKGRKVKDDTKNKLSKINASLTKDQILEIFELKGEKSYKEIGEIYGINISSVWAIINKVSYKWVWL